ncbi:Gryzun, putative trafficking through golgi-domain-containing protein [Dichomitus squalens]|uniref:Gryzun, putative trafficking through golgi-domain-containing protein n=1 Tax=Dichomitus squalens TaxID=114155 RepID=A0A4Q9M3G7_9APHY|nr:Gryzun, putative trafficking through golgi-domain-containing protein [Dichomitus squalens]
MNSYPPELLVQLAPVMFVAGLEVPPPHQPQTPASASAHAPPPKTPTTPAQQTQRQDPFNVLSTRLRDALLAQRKVAIWQPDKSKTFQVVLVDKDVPFPPRKMLRPDEPGHSSSHSPLSPLTPSSPLHPDGLIAPIWIRKHTTLVPSVFVLFMRIYESPPPLPGQEQNEKEREAEERRRDTELAAEIAQRKKSTNERNIKLTAVLMASRRMLDDPTLDARLTFIRRQSGLDPRAALFVLSPVSQAEIGDFVRSLQEALYEPALEYYTNHSKRVRRKRNRHSQASVYQMPISPLASAGIARPLRPEGWTVRYEYKMACFAEFRGEDQVALKHYQDAYSTLIIMFGSTAILPPRTKRWAEAKVLADCITVKIVKLYLYNNEHALALSHQNGHMRKFADFSRGWGIGEETFEFWSWLARQHRVFAELLEQGTRSTLKIPSAYPPPALSAAAMAAQVLEATQMGLDTMRVLGLNPNQALQHPGFYYYMAARCTERRRERFLSALESDGELQQSNAPGFVNEKKVDHLTIALELYTRAYELFKKWSPQQGNNPGRLTLWIAYRIAQTYHDSGKFDMAVRFFERIARTYRRESWQSLLHPLLSQWYKCAQQLGDVDLSVRLLVEMLAYGTNASPEDPDALQDDLLAVLQSTVPSATDEPLVIDLSEFKSLLSTSVVFWEPEVDVGMLAPVQIHLSSLPHVSLSSVSFTSLAIHFNSDVPSVIVKHVQADPDAKVPSVQRVDIGEINVSPAPAEPQEVVSVLRWGPGSTIVLAGSVASDLPMHLSVSKLVLTIKERSWWIEVPIVPEASRPDDSLMAPKWLCTVDPPQYLPMRREDHTGVRVRYRSHRIHVSISHNGPAYIGEDFPVEIDVTNTDDRELDVTVDVLLQPTEIDEAVNYIAMDDQRSTSLIKTISCGSLAPGTSILKKLVLTNTGGAGERVIDISVQSESHASNTVASTPTSSTTPTTPSHPPLVDRTETLRTIAVEAIHPIKVAHQATYRRPTRAQPGLADLETFEGVKKDEASAVEAIVTSTLTVVAPAGIEIESILLSRKNTDDATIVDCSADTDDFNGEWLSGDELSSRCTISVVPDEDEPDRAIPGAGEYEVRWRRISFDSAHGALATTTFPLPPLHPPSDGLVALLDAPTTAHLHQPIPLRLTVRNRHPSRSANVTVRLEPDAATDAFIVSGLRHGRMPILLPGAEENITWNLIPVECGLVRVPSIKVLDRRSAVQISQQTEQGIAGQGPPVQEGDEVRIVDVRWEARREAEEDGVGKGALPAVKTFKANDVFVLVLP